MRCPAPAVLALALACFLPLCCGAVNGGVGQRKTGGVGEPPPVQPESVPDITPAGDADAKQGPTA